MVVCDLCVLPHDLSDELPFNLFIETIDMTIKQKEIDEDPNPDDTQKYEPDSKDPKGQIPEECKHRTG